MSGFVGEEFEVVSLRDGVGGVLLRGLRSSLGLSRKHLAEFLRVGVVTVGAWETDKRECPEWVFKALSALHESFYELVELYALECEQGDALELFDDSSVWVGLYPRARGLPVAFQNAAVMAAFVAVSEGCLGGVEEFVGAFYVPGPGDGPQVVWK